MNRDIKGLILGLAVSSGAPPAMADDTPPPTPEVEIIDSSDDCGGATLEAPGAAGVSVRFPSFVAETSLATPRLRKVCVLRFKVKPPEKCGVLRDDFEVSGSATVPRGARGTNLSVRYFAPGEAGADHFKAFEEHTGSGSFSDRSKGTAEPLPVEKEVILSLIIDVTVHAATDDPSKKSSVTITQVKIPMLLHRGDRQTSAPAVSATHKSGARFR